MAKSARRSAERDKPGVFSPGPWSLRPHVAHPWVVEAETVYPGIKAEIVEVSYRPNAVLIAAAPDMLKALAFVASRIGDHGKLAASPETLKEWAAVIDVAIAKASA